jgi:hypothetical protein
MSHPFNKSATLRDVLEARNFVTRTVLNAANTIISLMLGIALCVLLEFSEIEGHYHWWNWLLAAMIYTAAWKYFRLPPSESLRKSEEACAETPLEPSQY